MEKLIKVSKKNHQNDISSKIKILIKYLDVLNKNIQVLLDDKRFGKVMISYLIDNYIHISVFINFQIPKYLFEQYNKQYHLFCYHLMKINLEFNFGEFGKDIKLKLNKF